MAETTPPPLQGPTSKEKKYDRQLRLWGANGQQALEEAHVLLVNPSLTNTDDQPAGAHLGTGVVGVEALKNVILPGVGNYTIVDDATVSDADLGINFFLEEESLGKSRAAETCKLLQELNPDVNGNFIPKASSFRSIEIHFER
jgi:NEDD8-activating enzyme E1 regulatory subunit